ncbi:MAG TPA: DsrE/DsrF/DrsH-like family protein, partial [Kaistiaceae bacterium]|nr:DsrE/DsrF/DrsH-like family protein [Kaistiaceae bacterium]
MATITNLRPDGSAPDLADADRERFDRWFDARFEEKMREREAAHVPSMSIIATKGTLDWAYPPFILASTGAALEYLQTIYEMH